MRDQVEIGAGRTAARAYELSDIDIVPSRRTRTSKDVSTAWQVDAYRFDIPLVTHPSDAIVSPSTAVRIGELGGMAVLNAEGVWARHENPEKELVRVADAARAGGPSAGNRVLQELHAAPVREDLLSAALATMHDAGITVAARVSPQHASELTPTLVSGGVEVLLVHGTIISAEHVAKGSEPLNLSDFIGSLDIPVIAGGISDYRTAMHLMRTGAAGVVVGHGLTRGVTTTGDVLGIRTPMATAVAEAAAARRDYLDETGGRYVHVIADGSIDSAGDIAKVIACGADAVMLGEQLAAAREAPGGGAYWTTAAAHPNLPRSAVSVTEPDADLTELLFGPTSDPSGKRNLFGSLRRALAKTGYSDLKEFQKVGLSVRA